MFAPLEPTKSSTTRRRISLGLSPIATPSSIPSAAKWRSARSWRSSRAVGPPVGRARRHLERIVELLQAGAVKPPEIKLYRLSQAADAHRLSESRHFRGKLVFQVR